MNKRIGKRVERHLEHVDCETGEIVALLDVTCFSEKLVEDIERAILSVTGNKFTVRDTGFVEKE